MTGVQESSIKRSLAELKTLYMLKPELRDVFVEGRDDAALVRWYLQSHSLTRARVYGIDDRVIVPRPLVEAVDHEINTRGRVVALASQAAQWQLTESSITCIVDADYELLRPRNPIENLLLTDFAAMEIYALQEAPLTKFLVGAAKSEITASAITTMLKPAWSAIYALRYVLHNHTDGQALVSGFAAKCIDDAQRINVDLRELLRASGVTGTNEVIDSLLAVHHDYLALIPSDTLQGIRGHDAAHLIIRYLGLKNDMAKTEAIERLFRMSLEASDLDDQPLFRSLVSRVS